MNLYGVDGVFRSVESVDCGINGVLRHAYDAYVGVGGVRKRTNLIVGDIDRIEVRIGGFRYWSSDDIEIKGSSKMSDMYSSVKLKTTANTFTITVSRSGYRVYFYPDAYVVFKDGHAIELNYLRKLFSERDLKIAFSSNYSDSGSKGWFSALFCGADAQEKNESFVVSDENYKTWNGSDGYFYAYSDYSGHISVNLELSVTFDWATIDGKSIPIRVVNNIKP